MRRPRRLPDWEARLDDHFERWESRAFVWGESDCAAFIIEGVEQISGMNICPELATARAGAADEAAVLAALGAPTLTAAIVHALGRSCHPAMAGRGDVVMSLGGALGIWAGTAALFVGDQGLVAVKRADLARAWKIRG